MNGRQSVIERHGYGSGSYGPGSYGSGSGGERTPHAIVPMRAERGGAETMLPPSRGSWVGGIDREALYAEFEPLVRRLIRQYGRTPELRHDLEGEIYCRFCGFLEAYDPERGIPLRPYLVRQLTATTYTYTRQHWRVASREYALQEAEVDCGFGGEADPTSEWLQAICQEEMASRLPAAMSRLPQRQRQVVIWRYYEERSFEEIASTLGVQSATVRSLLRHGLNNLRKHIGAPEADLDSRTGFTL